MRSLPQDIDLGFEEESGGTRNRTWFRTALALPVRLPYPGVLPRGESRWVESLLEHPATMTHAAAPAAGRREMGITDGLVRFSVSLETVADLQQALAEGLDPY